MNPEQLARKPLTAHVLELIDLLKERLARHKSERNLLTYDGSIFDQISYALVTQLWHPEEFDVVCSTRPCMSSALKAEVRDFAERHNYPLLLAKDDCTIDFRTMRIQEHRCSNLQDYISTYFSNSNSGLLIIGAIINENTLNELKQTFDWYADFTEVNEVIWKSRDYVWKNLLLFHNFMAYEIVSTYVYLTNAQLFNYHVPICYVPCFFEMEKLRVRAVIERCVQDIQTELMNGGSNGKNNH